MALSDEERLAVLTSLEKIAKVHLVHRGWDREWGYDLAMDEYARIAGNLDKGIAFDPEESKRAISRAAEQKNRERKLELFDGYNDEADAPDVTAELRDYKMPKEERESIIDDELEGDIPAPASPSDLDSPAYKKAWYEFDKLFYDSLSKPSPPPETYSNGRRKDGKLVANHKPRGRQSRIHVEHDKIQDFLCTALNEITAKEEAAMKIRSKAKRELLLAELSAAKERVMQEYDRRRIAIGLPPRLTRAELKQYTRKLYENRVEREERTARGRKLPYYPSPTIPPRLRRRKRSKRPTART